MKSILFTKNTIDSTMSIFKYGGEDMVEICEKTQAALLKTFPDIFKDEVLIRFDFKNEDDFEKIKELGLNYSVTKIFEEFEKGNMTAEELYKKYR